VLAARVEDEVEELAGEGEGVSGTEGRGVMDFERGGWMVLEWTY
jgi:hypothetical protein